MNPKLEFLSYEQAHSCPDDTLIVCDCYYPRGLNLTHLYSERVPQEYRSNTSTETVLKWLAEPNEDKPGAEATKVTCNHWDIDGFLAVWAACNPNEALKNTALLIAAATLGDFREFDHTDPMGLEALKICCLLNAVEAKEFCLPFGDLEDATIEYQVAVQKFTYFLQHFNSWLDNLESYEDLWIEEYRKVLHDIRAIEQGAVHITEYTDPGISVVTSDIPLHYYAIFSHVKGGAVLTELAEPHYIEFEYRYETAVGKLNKSVLKRLDLSAVAESLTSLEKTERVEWVFDNIHEGGTMLRPQYIDTPLSHEDRYQSLSYREAQGLLCTTSLKQDIILKKILDLFA